MNTYEFGFQSEEQIAEYSVIGACLVGDCDTFRSLTITPEHFGNKMCASAFEIIRDWYQSNKEEITPVLLSSELRKNGHFITTDDILRMVDLCPVTSIVKDHERLVIQYSKIRAAKNALADIALDNVHAQSADDAISDAILALTKIVKGDKNEGFSLLSDCLVEAYLAYTSDEKPTRYDLGIDECDYLLKGIRPTDYVIIAARPAVGKSAFAGQFAVNMAAQGAKVALYSLEMPGRQIAERMIAKTAEMDLSVFYDQNCTEKQKYMNDARIADAAYRLNKLPIYMSNRTNITPSVIYRDIADKKKDIVIIDHIGLMRADRKYENRNNEISQISRDLRLIAMNTGIPIIALCQLSRAAETRADKRPQLSDLRDSGSLEQDATTVIALSQYKNNDNGLILFETLKNRRGLCGKTILYFDKPHMTFNQSSTKYEPDEPKPKRVGL